MLCFVISDVYIPLIDSSKQIIYDRYRIIYAEILYSWGYLEQRAEILKFVTEQHLNVTESPPFGNFFFFL